MNAHVQSLDISALVRGNPTLIHPALIWDDRRAVLVDAGFPGQLELFRAAVEAAGIPFDRLDTLILTHQDLDHIGSAAAIRAAREGGLRVLTGADEAAYIAGERTPVKLAAMQANLPNLPEETRAFFQTMQAAFQASYLATDATLHDGEVLPIAGGLQVIATPGHTPGHICLYLPESRTLIAGDALTVRDGALACPSEAITHDMPESKRSLRKLAALPIDTVLTYHGGAFHGDCAPLIAALAG